MRIAFAFLVALPLPAQSWPESWEREFQKRCDHVVASTTRAGRYGSTWFENEKRSYGWAMLSILGGQAGPALKFLQEEDPAKDWNKHTLGIDYFPCFTLKHQMRKLFYFGDRLEPKYRSRMLRAAKIFTEKDPLRRPHHAYVGKQGWGPDAKNSWVDVRSTDNLKLMRETSVYLLAEVSGNRATQDIYRKRLTDYVVAMFHGGMGEFDSENYLGHSIAPLLNLHDFAKDAAVRNLARAALDWMSTVLALKYWRGPFGGPTRRDYNHPYPFGGSAASTAWLWFGGAPMKPDHFESDEIHAITSSYRPPVAVVKLARREFPRPLEITSGKPQWAAWEHMDDEAPAFRETSYFGERFQLGTLARGTQQRDVNGFKALLWSKQRGADTVIAAPVSEPLRIGSPQYQDDILAGPSAVGQNGPLALWIARAGDQPFSWLIPIDAEVKVEKGLTLVTTEAVTFAIWPIQTEPIRVDKQRSEAIAKKWPLSKILSAERSGDRFYGFAIEFADRDREAFARRARALRPETDEVPIRGAAAMTGVQGQRLRVQWGEHIGAIKIWRDGKLRRWDAPEERASFRTYGDRPLVEQSWQGDGSLQITVGDARHRVVVDRDGRVSFN